MDLPRGTAVWRGGRSQGSSRPGAGGGGKRAGPKGATDAGSRWSVPGICRGLGPRELQVWGGGGWSQENSTCRESSWLQRSCRCGLEGDGPKRAAGVAKGTGLKGAASVGRRCWCQEIYGCGDEEAGPKGTADVGRRGRVPRELQVWGGRAGPKGAAGMGKGLVPRKLQVSGRGLVPRELRGVGRGLFPRKL